MDYQEVLEREPRLAETLRLRRTKYNIHQPTPKQRIFLSLPHREAFYGGAAGGGKSDTLLDGALQYVDIPNYSALILRKTIADLELQGALLSRSREWLTGTDAVLKDLAWHFPSGAVIQFGYLDQVQHKYRYQGAHFQYIAFDELTQFLEEDFLYLHSRLRRPRCPHHAGRVIDGFAAPLEDDPNCPTCIEFGPVSRVPLRIRAASNPGGIGHAWVRKRYQIRRTTLKHHGRILYMGQHPERPHIPAFVEDNPYLDQEEYVQSLKELDPVTRAQLLSGDWAVSAESRYKLSWARLYRVTGEHVTTLRQNGRPVRTFRLADCFRFMIVDPAASADEGAADIHNSREKRSWWAIGSFLVTPDGDLLIWSMSRSREEFPVVFRRMKDIYRNFRPSFIGMELSPISSSIYQLMVNAYINVTPMKPQSRDKVARAAPSINRMEQGKIFLPEHTTDWLEDFTDEIFTWTGDKEETDDQIDVLSYAGIYITQEHAFTEHGDQDMAGVWLDDYIPESIM